MPYSLRIKRSAEKELDDLPKHIFDRVAKIVERLKNEPFPHGTKKLSDRDDYRIRIGDWRVLYTVDHHTRTIEIITVGHRRDVYR